MPTEDDSSAQDVAHRLRTSPAGRRLEPPLNPEFVAHLVPRLSRRVSPELCPALLDRLKTTLGPHFCPVVVHQFAPVFFARIDARLAAELATAFRLPVFARLKARFGLTVTQWVTPSTTRGVPFCFDPLQLVAFDARSAGRLRPLDRVAPEAKLSGMVTGNTLRA